MAKKRAGCIKPSDREVTRSSAIEEIKLSNKDVIQPPEDINIKGKGGNRQDRTIPAK